VSERWGSTDRKKQFAATKELANNEEPEAARIRQMDHDAWNSGPESVSAFLVVPDLLSAASCSEQV
jgi:hypothetical protein